MLPPAMNHMISLLHTSRLRSPWPLGEKNCTIFFGGLVVQKSEFFAPLVGSYAALASLACLICFFLDVFGDLFKKQWVPAKYYSLNAATLTLLAVATKIPSDTSEVMPGFYEQFAKLSGVALVCLSMNHMMPSLGLMDDQTIFSNVVALMLLVVTLFVNVIYQCYTGLITIFRPAIIVMSIGMLFIFFMFASHALSVSTVKKLLIKQYNTQHNQTQNEIETQCQGYLTNHWYVRFCSVLDLKDYVNRYCVLAHTSSPDYTLQCSGVATASALLTFTVVGFGYFLTGARWRNLDKKTCYLYSDYKISALFIFIVQSSAIGVGLCVSAFRIIFNRSTFLFTFTSVKSMLRIDRYRIQKLLDWKDSPISFHVGNKRFTKYAYKIRNAILSCFICLQSLVILFGKFILFPVILLVSVVLLLVDTICCRKTIETGDDENSVPVPNSEDLSINALKPYALYVEGRPLSDDKIKKRLSQTTSWIEKGRYREPRTITCFLQNFSTPTEGFKAVTGIYSELELENATQTFPNCWSLTIVTLAVLIRVSFRSTSEDEDISTLLKATYEGFRYARFVDENFPLEGSQRMIKAAKKTWDTLKIFDNWMNEDLVHKENSLAIIRELQNIAHNCVSQVRFETPHSWSLKAIAADCLYKITKTITNSYGQRHDADFSSRINAFLLPILKTALADTIGACLLSVPRAILSHCSSGTFGAREDRVRKAAIILGETEKVLEWISTAADEDKCRAKDIQYVDSWSIPANLR